MTIKEYLDRNDKIREIANNLGIDIEQYNIDLSVIPTNFTFKLRKECYEVVKPVIKEGRLVVYNDIQICWYEPCMYTLCEYDKWKNVYLKELQK